MFPYWCGRKSKVPMYQVDVKIGWESQQGSGGYMARIRGHRVGYHSNQKPEDNTAASQKNQLRQISKQRSNRTTDESSLKKHWTPFVSREAAWLVTSGENASAEPTQSQSWRLPSLSLAAVAKCPWNLELTLERIWWEKTRAENLNLHMAKVLTCINQV